MKVAHLLPALTAGILISGWAALASRYPPVLLPSPHEVLQASISGASTLAEATATTAIASLIGMLIAVGFGLLGAMLFSRSKWLEAALYPYALLLQTVPIVAIAPLLVVWLGYGIPPAVASAAIVSFFPPHPPSRSSCSRCIGRASSPPSSPSGVPARCRSCSLDCAPRRGCRSSGPSWANLSAPTASPPRWALWCCARPDPQTPPQASQQSLQRRHLPWSSSLRYACWRS